MVVEIYHMKCQQKMSIAHVQIHIWLVLVLVYVAMMVPHLQVGQSINLLYIHGKYGLEYMVLIAQLYYILKLPHAWVWVILVQTWSNCLVNV